MDMGEKYASPHKLEYIIGVYTSWLAGSYPLVRIMVPYPVTCWVVMVTVVVVNNCIYWLINSEKYIFKPEDTFIMQAICCNFADSASYGHIFISLAIHLQETS